MNGKNPFQIKFRKGTKKRLSTVHLFNYGLCTVWPTMSGDKSDTIKETIDLAIKKLNELRILK